MERIVIDGMQGRELSFFLAMEEYVASRKDLEESMFFWNVGPTVIFGRNQVMSAEVDVPWCEENGVRMFRRKSGGGCVYSDWGNLMLSYVSSDTNVDVVFGRYLRRLADALCGLGLPAAVSGRNDILIDGRKVSGNAFQLLGDRSIVHGTLMYNVDFEALERAITPPENKLERKGVASVRQHVVNLKDCLWAINDGSAAVSSCGVSPATPAVCPVTDINSLAEYLAGQLCDSEVVLDSAAVAAICEIEKTYLDSAFIAGHEGVVSSDGVPSVSASHEYVVFRSMAVGGVGNFTLKMNMFQDRIAEVHVSGDYFTLATPEDIDSVLTTVLRGLPFQKETVLNALSHIYIEKLIPNLTLETFANLILG